MTLGRGCQTSLVLRKRQRPLVGARGLPIGGRYRPGTNSAVWWLGRLGFRVAQEAVTAPAWLV